jgi:hypothetical protein
VQSLHAGYMATYQEAQKELNEVLQDASRAFQETQDFAAFTEKTPPARKKFSEKAKAAEASLFADARSLLTEGQEAQWPKVERMRRRELAARLSVVSGDTVDLTEIVNGLKVTVEGPLAEALDDYETEADRAIQGHLRISESSNTQFEPGRTLQMEELQKQMAESREAALKRKDVNQRHARKIEPMLPEEKRPEFRDALKRQSFPQVYRQSQASKWIEAASKMSDLSSEQREQITTLRDQYQRDLKSANEAWAAAIEKTEAEPQNGGTMAGPGGTMMVMMGDENQELAAARKARRELDEKAREKVKSVLTPEQQETLPKPEDEGVMVPGGGGRMIIRGG